MMSWFSFASVVTQYTSSSQKSSKKVPARPETSVEISNLPGEGNEPNVIEDEEEEGEEEETTNPHVRPQQSPGIHMQVWKACSATTAINRTRSNKQFHKYPPSMNRSQRNNNSLRQN